MRRELITHRMRAAAALVAMMLVAVACAGGGQEGTEQATGTGSPTAQAGTQRAEDQTLVAAYPDDQFATSELNAKRFPNYPLNANVCEPLVRLTEDFGVEGVLAEDWEYTGDNTFRFTLKDEPTFSNGDPVTAEDVAYTLNYGAEEPQVGGLSFLEPDSTQVAGENAVTVTPGEPNLRLIEQINHPTFAILQEGIDPLKALQEAGGRLTAEDDNAPVCTGPFTFVEYVENEHVIVEKNDDYWGEQEAQLDEITFRFIPDESTRVLALQSGEVDVVADVERTLVADLEAEPGIKIVRAPPGQVHLFYIARRTAEGEQLITDNPEVRRAIAHAMDRDAYVDGVLGGEAERVNTVNPPSTLGQYADMVEGIPHDPEAARAALEDAGWTEGDDGVYQRDGERLEVRIIFSPARNTVEQATWIQGQLEEVGFDAEVLQLEAAAYDERTTSGDYEIDLSVPNQNNANPAFLLALRWYSKARGDNARIISPGPDTEFDKLIDQTLETSDFDELRRLSAEAMHQLVDVEIGTVPLAGTYRIYAMKESVQGFEPHPSGINQRWDTVFLAE